MPHFHVDGSGTTLFQYDHRGNMLVRHQAIGTTTAANLTYAYDLADRITQITYPSGRIVGYVRDSKGRVTTVRTKASSGVATWTNIATSVAYEAFGSLKTATLGNTLSMTVDWGNDGRLASRRLYVTSGGANRSLLTYAYDNDDNITGITDGFDATQSVSYVHGTQNRLTRGVANTGTHKRNDYILDQERQPHGGKHPFNEAHVSTLRHRSSSIRVERIYLRSVLCWPSRYQNTFGRC